MVSSLNKEKYINALHYFVANCNNEKLGVVKLNKLFYYLDFISYRDKNKSITNETYIRLPKGPFAKNLEKIIKSAKRKGLIDSKEEESKKYGKRNRFKATQEPDLNVFDEYEKELLKKLCKKFKDWSTNQMIAQTHTEAPWVFSDVNETISYKDSDDIEFFSVTK